MEQNYETTQNLLKRKRVWGFVITPQKIKIGGPACYWFEYLTYKNQK